MTSPFSGSRYLLEGFRLIAKPGIRQYVYIPLAINVLLFTALFFTARHYMIIFNHWFADFLPAWLHWLSLILWFLFFVSFFLVFVYAFVTVANILCAPFNSFLSEKVEFYLTGKIQEPRTLWQNIQDIPRIIGRQLGILGYFIPRGLLILVLLFIPVIQSFAAIIWFLFHAWLMTMTYLDYPTDNHRIPMPQVRTWMAERRGASLGFGIGVLITTMIPILNFLTIPAAVAGATKFWVEVNSVTHSR